MPAWTDAQIKDLLLNVLTYTDTSLTSAQWEEVAAKLEGTKVSGSAAMQQYRKLKLSVTKDVEAAPTSSAKKSAKRGRKTAANDADTQAVDDPATPSPSKKRARKVKSPKFVDAGDL